jgi:hypothetical protein
MDDLGTLRITTAVFGALFLTVFTLAALAMP